MRIESVVGIFPPTVLQEATVKLISARRINLVIVPDVSKATNRIENKADNVAMRTMIVSVLIVTFTAGFHAI